MANPQTFLQLAPEMGGLRFGPFQGAIQIGSDPKCNQLVLDRSHGIFPSHATIVETAPGVYTVGPTQQGCQVFLMQAGQAHVWPIAAPVQAKAGDQVIFGTPQGPRFEIQSVGPDTRTAAEVVDAARKQGGEAGFLGAASTFLDRFFGPPSQGGVAGEIQRQARARMLTRSPWREIYGFHTRLRSGALTNPVYIVSALSGVGAVLLGGSATCSGVFYAIWNAFMR